MLDLSGLEQPFSGYAPLVTCRELRPASNISYFLARLLRQSIGADSGVRAQVVSIGAIPPEPCVSRYRLRSFSTPCVWSEAPEVVGEPSCTFSIQPTDRGSQIYQV